MDTDLTTREPVIPTVDCYENQSDGSTVFLLGYDNRNAHNVNIYLGPENAIVNLPAPLITPGGELGAVQATLPNATINDVYLNYGQPTKFLPGRYSMVFRVK